jgi:hypothetical protein
LDLSDVEIDDQAAAEGASVDDPTVAAESLLELDDE